MNSRGSGERTVGWAAWKTNARQSGELIRDVLSTAVVRAGSISLKEGGAW
jgi:hypothetical protein